MTVFELQPYVGHHVTFVLSEDADRCQIDAAECVGTFQAIVNDEAIWGESLGVRWIPIGFILGVDIMDHQVLQ